MKWTFNEKPLREDHRVRKDRQELRVSDVRREDQGRFSCRPRSSLGVSNEEKIVQVFVKGYFQWFHLKSKSHCVSYVRQYK